MEMIEVTQLPDSQTLLIDVDVEMFMDSQRAGELLAKLQASAIQWKPKQKP